MGAGGRQSLTAVVFDLDGVIRHYDRDREREIEALHGIESGTLVPTAFGGPAGRAFMCGQLDHDAFALELAVLIGSHDAARAFVDMRAVVDPEAVELVRSLQEVMPVALLTNGSLRTRIELEEAGLHDAFDHVFNSAETGVPKPEAAAYLNAVATLGSTVATTAFIDDLAANVVGAVDAGLVGHLYLGLSPLRGFLAEHGLI